jgi:FkbH-like protein
VAREAERIRERLAAWIRARAGAETYVALPPLEFLPVLDACKTATMGPVHVSASTAMWALAQTLSEGGARLLRLSPSELSYRDLLLSGCPMTPEYAEHLAARLVEAAYDGSPRKKALVVDLDGTLWHGIIGEDGLDGIACRAEGRGFPFYVFQEFLLKLKNEGVLLAFCSKNNPDDVLPRFDAMDMPLKLADFAAHRCNWEPKSKNLAAIAGELNIGLDALVFIDDDQAELAEVRHRAPAVTGLRTPSDGKDWKGFFDALQDAFATWRVSEEDRLRTQNVAAGRQRAVAAGGSGSGDRVDRYGHLSDMQLEIVIQRDAFQDPRSLELINKTNQFNLTGERFSQEEWLAWSEMEGAFCFSARLKDRFGDFGTIGVVTGRMLGNGEGGLIRQFVLSCRAFGRGVEAVVLAETLRELNQPWLEGPFKDTGKNEPARRFFMELGCPGLPEGRWHVEAEAALRTARGVLEQSRATVSWRAR